MGNQYGKDLTVEEVQNRFRKNGFIPLFDSYKNAKEKLLCINKDGYKVLLCYDKLQQGRNPQPFSMLNPYTIENIKIFMIKNKRDDILISSTFMHSYENKLNFICKNGHNFDMLWRHYKNGSSCPKCSKYKGEEKIIELLKELHINFEYQKKFDGLIGLGNKHLSYDFYLPQYNLLIEYQGEQHERPIEHFGGEKQFKKQLKHDAIKKEYTVNNNINLLEIWYYEYNKIEEILKEYVNATTCSFIM